MVHNDEMTQDRYNARVSSYDCAFAHQSVAYLVGPLQRVEDPSRLLQRLLRIAAGGPSNRIGFTPGLHTRDWQFDESCRSVAITQGHSVDFADPAAAVAELMRTGPSVPDVTLRIHLAEPWLFLNFDHGLGGGRLFTEIIAAVGADDPGFAAPPPLVGCSNPGLQAVAHTLRTSPIRLVRALDEPFRNTPSPGKHLSRFDGEVAAVYARSDPDFLVRLRERRDRELPGVSVSAIITSLFLGALSAQEVAMEDEISFMVDLGRHLPRGVGTLANFIGGSRFTVSPPYRPSDIATALEAYTIGCRALVRYGIAYTARLAGRRASSNAWTTGSTRVKVAVTDHSVSPAAKKIGWAASSDGHVFVRVAPVGFANQVTLAINRVESQLHLTASHYPSVIDSEKLQRALDMVVAEGGLSKLSGR